MGRFARNSTCFADHPGQSFRTVLFTEFRSKVVSSGRGVSLRPW